MKRLAAALLWLALAVPAAAQQTAQQRIEATIGALVTQNAAQAAQIEQMQALIDKLKSEAAAKAQAQPEK